MIVRRFVSTLLVAWLLAGLSAPPAAAQSNQPVYPVYDGFHVAEDGVHVISYAYFSHNFDTVTIPPGAANAFGAEPADRLQPTTFEPGHHRFQCVMVMDADFTGGLRWTLSHAGTTTSTSEDMLQYNWELDDRTARSVLRDVDAANAPRGGCLNRSPLVRFLGLRSGPEGEPPEVSVSVGEELKLFGSVRDEGLPRDGRLTSAWRMLAGSGQVFEDLGFESVTTYIQSGNVLFRASETRVAALTRAIEAQLSERLSNRVQAVVFTRARYRAALAGALETWGRDDDRKHNALFPLRGVTPQRIVEQLPVPKPDIETLATGRGVIFWSISKQNQNRTTWMKLAAAPVYQQVTVRNHRTVFRLRELLDEL